MPSQALSGFYLQVFFTVVFSRYISAMGFLFSLETPQTFQKHFICFLHLRRMTLPGQNGISSSCEPFPLFQHDQNIHLNLARITRDSQEITRELLQEI